MHSPFSHTFSEGHAPWVPHLQPPAEQLSAFDGLQPVHALPPVPHALKLDATHAPAAQQPFGQDVASQTHWAPTQRFPAPHVGPVPHAHAPAVQRSAVSALHAPHAPPVLPQLSSDWPVQTFPAQQPDVHEAASQVQTPALQRWPAPHAGPLPHAHAPPELQALAVTGLQAVHVAPPLPQLPADGTVHVLPAQHPFGQLEPLQVPPVQTPLLHV